MTVKQYYLENFPTDDMGEELNENATFMGLLEQLFLQNDVYEYLDVYDSVIRERVFAKLAQELDKPYNYIYDLWMGNVSIEMASA